jgi:hypothetical protein
MGLNSIGNPHASRFKEMTITAQDSVCQSEFRPPPRRIRFAPSAALAAGKAFGKSRECWLR